MGVPSILNAAPDDERPVRLSARFVGILATAMTTLIAVGVWAVPDHLKLKDDFHALRPEVRQLQREVTALDERQDAADAREAAEREALKGLMQQVLDELRKRDAGRKR
jgi:hypothetical protein